MGRFSGVVTGKVTSVDDPDGQGRVQVNFPWLGGQNQGYWSPVATLMSGGGRGSWFMPVVGDEVLVAFEQEDVNHSYVIGYMWNGQDTPPSTDTNLRTIRSVNGHEIQLYDPPVSGGDQGYIRLQYARGDGSMNIVEINNTGIVIQSDSSITLSAPTITINGRPVSISTSPI
ncbi:MAG: phage baseplate assembly protein V [Terracidiphilus sp.]